MCDILMIRGDGRMEKFHRMNLEEIQKCSNKELEDIILCMENTKLYDFHAECLYWLCMLEVNIRADQEIEHTWIQCIANIRNKEGNMIFQFGRDYMVFVIGTVLLVLTDGLIPYVFSSAEEDPRCIWKYFTESMKFKNLYLM